jgi:hypothetical protein
MLRCHSFYCADLRVTFPRLPRRYCCRRTRRSVSRKLHYLCCNARQIFNCQRSDFSVAPIARLSQRRRKSLTESDSVEPPSVSRVFLWLVGLGRFELPTSPLSGVRSNQLSYRPKIVGGAGRDRTGGLLNANQALSQLSYSPLVYK